jgi:hypothetical protein
MIDYSKDQRGPSNPHPTLMFRGTPCLLNYSQSLSDQRFAASGHAKIEMRRVFSFFGAVISLNFSFYKNTIFSNIAKKI